MQVIAQRLTIVWLAKCKLWCKLWISLLVGLRDESTFFHTKYCVSSTNRWKNRNKISKQENVKNLSEPDANQERSIPQEKSDRRLDGANCLGMRYACFRGEVKFFIHFHLFVEDTPYFVWKNVDSSLHGKRIHLFISSILYTILSLRRPKFAKSYQCGWPQQAYANSE